MPEATPGNYGPRDHPYTKLYWVVSRPIITRMATAMSGNYGVYGGFSFINKQLETVQQEVQDALHEDSLHLGIAFRLAICHSMRAGDS